MMTTDNKLVDDYRKEVEVDISDVIRAGVGVFKLRQAQNINIEHLDSNASINYLRQTVERNTIVINPEDATTPNQADDYAKKQTGSGLAYTEGDKIVLPQYQVHEALKKDLQKSTNEGDQFLAGSSMSTISIFAHEATHALHYRQCSGQNDTPYMAAQMSDLTEQLANYNQYMTYAHIWKNAQHAGVKNLTIDGITMPVDNLLNTCPGLKEELTKNGFDEKDTACRERIAQIAANYWNTERAKDYAIQAIDFAKNSQNYSLMGAIVNAREWEDRKNAMVHNLRTGDGVTYDAPECLKYFLPSEERTTQILQDSQTTHVTNEQLLQLDRYMDKIGLKTDIEKAQFLKTQMECITYRRIDNPNYDKNFADLLLKQNSEDQQQISYADGLTASFKKDDVIISFGSDSITISKKDIENNNTMDTANLHQDIKDQKGKYPPDAPTEELAQKRDLADKQISNACTLNDYHKQKAVEKENTVPTRQPQQQDVSSILLANAVQNKKLK